MTPQDWIAILGITATTLIATVTLLINQRREKEQQTRDDRLRQEQLTREDKLRQAQETQKKEEEQKRRTYSPHIAFDIQCAFYAATDNEFIVEFQLIANNHGVIRQKFTDIRLRVRGIRGKSPLTYWAGNEPRLAFPEKIIDNVSILPQNYNFFFVEPGIEQSFTFITKIPASISHIVAHAEFEYDQFTPHTTERVFSVQQKAGE